MIEHELRVLYLFAGKRKQDEEKYKKGLMPDTYLVGLNRLSQYNIEAKYIENSLSEALRAVSFNFANVPSLFASYAYDIVFSGTNPGLVFLNKYLMLNMRSQWVVYNTFLTNMLRRNPRGIKRKILDQSLRSSAAIFNPSTPQRDFLLEQGIDASKLFYLPYGVDREFIDSHRGRPRLVTEPYIFSAGKDMGRDYQTLIDAVRGLPIQLYIGASPRNFKHIHDIPENVHITFYTPVDLVTMYEHAACVVIPTFHEDRLDASDCSGQYVLLESMMSGKAVIASDRSTIYDYVVPDEHAILVEPENVDALRDSIVSLVHDEERALRIGNAARERARGSFTTERFARDFAHLLKGLYA